MRFGVSLEEIVSKNLQNMITKSVIIECDYMKYEVVHIIKYENTWSAIDVNMHRIIDNVDIKFDLLFTYKYDDRLYLGITMSEKWKSDREFNGFVIEIIDGELSDARVYERTFIDIEQVKDIAEDWWDKIY